MSKFIFLIVVVSVSAVGGFFIGHQAKSAASPETAVDENPSATVFRFKEGKYRQVGEIKMQELGDFIEKQITKNQ